MDEFRVVVTDQVFPDVDVERELLGAAGGELAVAGGDRAEVLAAARDADALLNTSRGPIVVLDDVLAALWAGRLGGAGLDVFETEPLDPERLADVPNLLAIPHAAFYSGAAIRESQRKAATQVLKAIRGEPLDYQVG